MARAALSPNAPPSGLIDGTSAVRRTRSDVYRLSLATVLMFLLITVDVHNKLNIGVAANGTRLRYLLILIPCLSVLLTRLRRPSGFVRKPALSDLLLLALMIYGLSGTAFGTIF